MACNETKICEHCNVSCKNKYVLSTHLSKSKKCLELRGLSLSTKFICKGCEGVFSNNKNLSVHTESCKEYSIFVIRIEMEKIVSEYKEKILNMEKTITNLTEKYTKELFDTNKQHEKEMSNAIKNHDKEKLFLEKQLERIHTSYENFIKDAVNRPTTDSYY